MATSYATAGAAPISAAQWYYYLKRDPRGQPDGWYPYDPTVNQTVEQLYQNHQASLGSAKRAHSVVNLPMSSGFTYEIDFNRLVQRNTTSRKERPIARTTTGPAGLPPIHATARYVPAAMAAAAASSMAVPVPVAPVPSSAGGVVRCQSARGDELHYTAPEVLHEVKVDEAKVFVDVSPPKTKAKASDSSKGYAESSHDDDCVICLDLLWNEPGKRVVSLKGCEHKFHYDCIHEALTKAGAKCPLCSKNIQQEDSDSQTTKGKCPSGMMVSHVNASRHCQGFPHVGTIEINYSIYNGIQKSYHPHPGVPFKGAGRVAYLPNTPEGKDLLPRMQYAFAHGLSFMVGTSLTTSQPNVVTWASIHHKTSMTRGPFGYPDDTYFDRSNDELNQLGVPNATECRAWLANLS